MRLLPLWLLFSGAALGGTLKGVVVDNSTGRVLAGASVTARMLRDTGAVAYSARASRAGMFVFPKLPEGQFLLKVIRRGFLPFQYGQKSWKGVARPFTLKADGELFVEARMLRQPTVSGVVLDENDEGIPDAPVYVYTDSRPPAVVKQVKTDDRGGFRIGELVPGRYLVRSGAMELEDGYAILPTFHPETPRVEEASAVELGPEEVAQEVTVRPLAGRLVKLSVDVISPCLLECGPWPVRLVSDMIDRTIIAPATFENLPPGRYELYTEGPMGQEKGSGYLELEISGNRQARLEVKQSPRVRVTVSTLEGRKVPGDEVTVLARQQTLAGLGTPRKLEGGEMALAPGRWQFGMAENPKMYLASVGGRSDPTGWVEIPFRGGVFGMLQVVVSEHPGTITGRVVDSQGQPAVGAPVYAEWFEHMFGVRMGELRTAIAGTTGNYRFTGLAPGFYRLLASFDVENPEPKVFDAGSKASASVKDGGSATADLELYELR